MNSMMPRLITPEGYEELAEVLDDALMQASGGKGKERHANGKRFTEQPIFTITDNVGTGFLKGQAMKKIIESKKLRILKGPQAERDELLGAIVYIAAAIVHLKGRTYNFDPSPSIRVTCDIPNTTGMEGKNV